MPDDDSRFDDSRFVVPLVNRPLHVMMDVAEKCNLRCIHCPFVQWRDRNHPGATLPDALLDRLEREVFPNAWKVSLSAFHEPLMEPELLIRAIDACHRAGVPVIDFITNGLLFTETSAREILRRGVSRIYISVDGASPRTYDALRPGGSFTTWVEKLSMISAMRRSMGLENSLALSFICVMRHSNIHEASDLIWLASRHGVDIVELRYLMKVDVAAVSENEQVIHHRDETDRALDEAAARARVEGITLELTPGRFRDIPEEHWVTPPEKKLNCPFPWNSVVISPRGEIFGCCFWIGEDALAHLDDGCFSDIWNGEAFRRMRCEFTTGKIQRENCKDCIVHYTSMADPGYWKTRRFTFVSGDDADRTGRNAGRDSPASTGGMPTTDPG